MAVATSGEIQGAAKQRQRSRAAGEANAAAVLDTDLVELYDRYSEHRREAFRTGLVPDGSPYKGRTWRPT